MRQALVELITVVHGQLWVSLAFASYTAKAHRGPRRCVVQATNEKPFSRLIFVYFRSALQRAVLALCIGSPAPSRETAFCVARSSQDNPRTPPGTVVVEDAATGDLHDALSAPCQRPDGQSFGERAVRARVLPWPRNAPACESAHVPAWSQHRI